MAGIGRKIGGATPNNQIRNAEARTAELQEALFDASEQSIQSVSVQPQPQQQVQQAIQQNQQAQKQTANAQNPALNAILTQLKTIVDSLNQIKVNSSVSAKETSKTSVTSNQVEIGNASIEKLVRSIASENLDEIKQRLLRIDAALSASVTSNTSNKDQTNAFSNVINDFTNKVSGTTANSSDTSAAEYNIKIDTSNIENAFNNFASRLEEIVGISKKTSSDINKDILLSVVGVNDDSKMQSNEITSNANEKIIGLNQEIAKLQQSFTDANNKTQKFYNATAANWDKERKKSSNDSAEQERRQSELLEALGENTAKQIQATQKAQGDGDPVAKLNKAMADLKEAKERENAIKNTDMSADRNVNNNAFNALDALLLKGAKTAANYAMGGGLVTFFKGKAAAKDVKKAQASVDAAQAEIDAGEADMMEKTGDNTDADLEMSQERTTIPDRPNKDLAQTETILTPETPNGVMAPSNDRLAQATNDLTRNIMLRNSAIDNFAESKEGKRSGQTADAMREGDPILLKMEAQLVQLTLIRAALDDQLAEEKRTAREAELRAAFEEGSEEPDNSIQLVPIEKGTEKPEPEKKEKKEGGGFLGLLMAGLSALFLGGGGVIAKIASFVGPGPLKSIFNFSFKGILKSLGKGFKMIGKLFSPIGKILKTFGSKLFGFLKAGIGKIIGPIGKIVGGIFKGGAQLIGRLIGTIMPMAGPVLAAVGVAVIGYQIGKLIGKWLKLDKGMDKLVGNKAAEDSNKNYTDQMRKEREQQDKNRAISQSAYENKVADIQKRRLAGEKLSVTEQTLFDISKGNNKNADRNTKLNTVMSAINKAGNDINKKDIADAIDFIDVNLEQVNTEVDAANKSAGDEFDKLSKKEMYAATIFADPNFKNLVKTPTLQATQMAIKMLNAEISRVNKLRSEATFWTSSRYSVDLDAMNILMTKLIKKRNALSEKEKYEKQKANLEKMKENAKDFEDKPENPPEAVKAPSEYKEGEKPVPLVDVETGIEEAKLPKNESNNNVDLTQDKMVDGSSTYVDPSRLTDKEKEDLLATLKIGDSAADGLYGNLFRNYVKTSIEETKKGYGDEWYERGDFPKFLSYYKQKWLKTFYEENQVLRWKDDHSGVDSFNKNEFSKAALDSGLVRAMVPDPDVKQDKMLDIQKDTVEPILISNDDIDPSMTNMERTTFNRAAKAKYDDDLEKYEKDKKAFEERKEKATFLTDDLLKEAHSSYLDYIEKNDKLGGTPESRRQLGGENWVKSFENGTVLLADENGALAMTKDEFFAKYGNPPEPPPPPTFYEMNANEELLADDISTEQEAIEAAQNEENMQQMMMMSPESVESGESNASATTAINNANEARAQATATKEKKETESAKAAQQAAAASTNLAAQMSTLTNPKSPNSISKSLTAAMKNAGENKEVVVYQSRRADNVMVKTEA